MSDDNRIVAVGLLTEADLQTLGDAFLRWYPVDETARFDDLLRAIDVADRNMIADRDD